VHLVLFLRTVGGVANVSAVDNSLIEEYVRELVRVKKENFVALYASQLPQGQQITTYLEFLQQASVPDARHKKEHWKLATQCNLVCDEIAMQLAEWIKRESRVDVDRAKDLQNTSLFLTPSPNLDELDLQSLNLLEWLAANDSAVLHLKEAALQLSQYFLG